jgi:hypothetical protein
MAPVERRFETTEKSAALVDRIKRETAKSARTSEVRRALESSTSTGSAHPAP